MLEWEGILKIFYLRFHLQIIPHPPFHPPYIVNISPSSLVVVSLLPVKFSGLQVLNFA